MSSVVSGHKLGTTWDVNQTSGTKQLTIIALLVRCELPKNGFLVAIEVTETSCVYHLSIAPIQG